MQSITKIIMLDDNGEKFFGEGPLMLLHAIEEHGSLRAAALSMQMAYSKALRILTHAEAVLGFLLTERISGGAGGGGSRLTKQGKEWMEQYERFVQACKRSNAELYLQFFGNAEPTARRLD